MASHGIASTNMSVDQFRELSGAVLRSVPSNLDKRTAQHWIENPNGLRAVHNKALRKTHILPSSFDYDKEKDRWTLLEDVADISIPNTTLVPIVNPGEHWEVPLELESIQEFAKKFNANLGQRHAEYFLRHQDEIPFFWREYFLLFPGTVWHEQHMMDHQYVAALKWRDDRYKEFGTGNMWSIMFHNVVNGWQVDDRLISLSGYKEQRKKRFWLF